MLRTQLTTNGDQRVIRVVCPECGCSGPQSEETDPPDEAQFKWNQRFDKPN